MKLWQQTDRKEAYYMFEELRKEEMQDIAGGSGMVVFDIVVGVVALYMAARELAKEAGRQAAYEELGYSH